jgi:ABC-type polysaccharide/polyol phosphate export permease
MVVKNLKGKYKNSYLGFLWHFITPAIMILLFYIVFTTIRYTDDEYYWAYLCVGIIPFTFFQSNLSAGAGCIVANGGMINKMYFPREIIVLSQVISTFITFVIGYAAIIVIMVISGFQFTFETLLFLPVIMALSFVFTTGYVLMTSAVTVYVRDLQYFIDAFSRLFFWVTPIFFYMDSITGILETILWCNPYTYFIELYHDILYYGTFPEPIMIMASIVLALAFLLIGVLVFNRYKGKFAEKL